VSTARHLLAFCLLGMTAALAGSCRDVVAGDSTNAVADFCGRLSDCDSAFDTVACRDIEERFESATDGEKSAALARLGGECLLQHCGIVRSCLDDDAFCLGESARCERDSDCCDFSLGYQACGVLLGGNPSCCAKRGRLCNGEETCCPPERCLPVVGEKDVFTCGGVVCAEVDDVCSTPNDCCTGLCADGVCVKDCVADNERCEDVGDCCTPDAECVALVDGGTPVCRPKPKPCEELECFPPTVCDCQLEFGEPLCGDADPRSCCLPPNADCSQGYDCCSGHCELVGAQYVCMMNGCKPEDEPCGGPLECCSGFCDPASSLCEESGCSVDCEASPCGTGGGKKTCSYPGGPEATALAQVLAQDPYCRCEWDSVCVTAYIGAYQVAGGPGCGP
jgi:hypothetical protein